MDEQASLLAANAYLQQDPIHHVDMLESLRLGRGHLLYAASDGVVLLDRQNDSLAVSLTCDRKKSEGILHPLSHTLYALHQRETADLVSARRPLKHWMVTRQGRYQGQAKLPGDFALIRTLDPSFLPAIQELYDSDVSYLLDRLAHKELWGYVREGELLGMIGRHDEGSMGLLAVKPQARHQGIATNLQAFVINHFLDRDWVPYGQVEIGNEASFQLSRKLGFVFSEQELYWLFD